MSRRPSDLYEIRVPPPVPAHKPSNLEKNCGNIFTKGPALTRDIFEKMQKDRRQIMGYEIETKQLWLLSGLLLLFLLSLSGMIAMWFTDSFDNVVFSKLAIAPNTQSYDMWSKPAPKPRQHVYIFNYTNIEEFEAGTAEKLNVQELGPYIYEMTLERIHAKYNGSRVTYQEYRVFKFLPELSKGRQNDRIVVPNIPLFTAAALTKHQTFFARMGLSGILNSLNAKPFISLPAHRYITGYEDNLYSLAKSYFRLQNKKVQDRVGLLTNDIGLRDDLITINTGETDINKVSYYENINGKTLLEHWSTDECNDISKSTDGSLYPPKLVRNKRPLKLYIQDYCRVFPLHYEKQVKILNGKIPAYRYVTDDHVFDSADKTPSNQCYCDMDLGSCPPQGVYNATTCMMGAPLFLSYPHFYNADPIVKAAVTGLNPNPQYQSYVDLHPTLGYTMAGKNRIQVNIQVKKAFGVRQMDMFDEADDGMILPVAWFELSLEDKTLPEDMVGIIFQTTFTLRSIELGLKYGCLLTMGVTLFGVLLVLRNRWTNRVRSSSIRPLRTNEEGV